MNDKKKPKLIIPAGTQVVCLVDCFTHNTNALKASGSVGRIVSAPTEGAETYTVRFPDGSECFLPRENIAIRKQVQSGELTKNNKVAINREFEPYIIYRCIVGSRAFGLSTPDSDVDRRGIFLPPASWHWSLYGVPEQVEKEDSDEVYWELQKFLVLALKANPNVLECLYTDEVETATPIAQKLLSIRSAFLSKLVYQTYNGYALSQFRKIEQDVRARGEIKWKHVMHLIRLLLSGIEILNTGTVPVKLDAHLNRLSAIRNGAVDWDEIDNWRLDLHRQFDQALAKTNLPERPNYAQVDAFLIEARQHMAALESD